MTPQSAPVPLRDWPHFHTLACDDSLALAIGVFSVLGQSLYLNRGMRALLGGDGAQSGHTGFVNPRFAELCRQGGDGEVFNGVLTLGDGVGRYNTISARAWRQRDRLLVVGEFDVVELDRLNTQLSQTNQEISNLQRELLKKNRLLEETLAELKQTQAMLIHAEKMNALGQLVAGVAHEIRNPLGFITGNLQSLQENFADLNAAYDELEDRLKTQAGETPVAQLRRAHFLDDVQQDAPALFTASLDGLKRIDGIVGSLRTFSRLDEASRKVTSLADNLRSTLDLVTPGLQEKGIRVTVDDGIDGLPDVECYPAELNQVFMNLILNASQAMETGGELSIRGSRPNGDWVELRFCDTGAGIEPSVQEKIFDPFFTTKPVGSGTGLGLTISHEIIVKLHGGRIDVSSEPGKGTCFRLELRTMLED